MSVFRLPEIDLFASRNNSKCKTFVSWRRDPDAFAVDAFTLSWTDLRFYAFPPFSLILKVLQKILADGATGVLVVPLWKTQPWFPLFSSMLITQPIVFPSSPNLLLFADRCLHPLNKNLTLAAAILSGKHSHNRV